MTYSVLYTRDEIVTASLRKLGVIAQGQAPTAQNLSEGAMALNTALAELRAIKVPLWARTTYSFSPIATVQSYTIGEGQTLNTVAPLHVLQAYRQDTTNSTRIPMEVVPDYNFNQYPTSAGGYPLQVTYQPKGIIGVIKLWPIPDSSSTSTTITLVYQRPFNYFSSGTDTLDMPQEYYNAVIYKTAVLLAPEWGIPLQDRQALRSEAQEYLNAALSTGEEDSSLFFQPRQR